MEEEELVDSNTYNNKGDNIRLALTWWEGKRIWFNLSVGLSGLIGLFLNSLLFNSFEIIGIIFYGLFANLLYSVGFLLEVFDNYYFKDRLRLNRFRLLLFLAGTIMLCVITFFMALLFYFL